MPACQTVFEKYSACVLIPTYNNAATLKGVLEDALAFTSHILVVNDGSTDHTEKILSDFPQIRKTGYSANRGKGFALRTGMQEALRLGYAYAIVMDSDGQHYAQDLPRFLEQLDASPGALIVGARNMQVDHVPVKSSFGNRFSNFWFWVNTGIRLPDTQSGYRLYPLRPLASRQYFTRKYEFEIEVMVRAAWSGIPVVAIPVSVYYPPAEERITHFRPFRDFVRISMLNTVLVLVALLYIKPRDLIRMLFRREGWKRIFRAVFYHPEESNLRKAASVGFGVFMGIVPVWGFQLAIGIPLAILFRLNKALFLLAANISIFPITPFWFMASLFAGKWLLGDPAWYTDWRSVTLEYVTRQGKAFFLGGTVLALTLSVVSFLLVYLVLLATGRKPVSEVKVQDQP